MEKNRVRRVIEKTGKTIGEASKPTKILLWIILTIGAISGANYIKQEIAASNERSIQDDNNKRAERYAKIHADVIANYPGQRLLRIAIELKVAEREAEELQIKADEIKSVYGEGNGNKWFDAFFEAEKAKERVGFLTMQLSFAARTTEVIQYYNKAAEDYLKIEKLWNPKDMLENLGEEEDSTTYRFGKQEVGIK